MGAAAGSALAADSDQGGARQSNSIDEVVVTATKGATGLNVSKVPISISAFSQRDLDSAGVKSIADVAAFTPGVNFSLQNSFGVPLTNIEIRGVQSRTSQPTTGIYLDDIPLITVANNVNIGGSNAYPIIFDLQRMEILRGPQGTLFGASSEGGTVRFVTNEPSLTTTSFYGRAEIAGTEHGAASYEGGAAMGGPIVKDTLGFRVSISHRRDGGWVNHCQPVVGHAGCLSLIEKDANYTDSTAVRGALTWAPNSWLKITPSLLYQNVYSPHPGDIEEAISNPDAGVFVNAHSTRLPYVDPLAVGSVKAEASLPGVTITSTTSYVWRNLKFHTDYTTYQDYAFFGNPYPLTGKPDDFGLGNYGIGQNDLSEEFRVASANPDSRLTWVVGAYLDADRQQDYAKVLHPNLPALIQANYGSTISQVLGVDPYLGIYVAYDVVGTKQKQEAIFGNADYKLTDTLKVTLGGRWAHFSAHLNSFFAGPFNSSNGEAFTGDVSESTFLPKGSINWTPDDHSLYYVSASKGNRPGGFNPQINNASPACQATLAASGLTVSHTYNSDSLWNFEVGGKKRMFNNRLSADASVYLIKWNNIQLSDAINGGCGFTGIFNLGSAESKGFDLSLQARVTDNLKLGLLLGYTDAYFTKDVKVGTDFAVHSGEKIAGGGASGAAIPPWSVTLSAEYDTMLMGRSVYGRAEDIFHSRNPGPFAARDPNNASFVQDFVVRTDPATTLITLRIGMLIGATDFSLFVNNVGNAHPRLNDNHTFGADPRMFETTFRPRTWGANATVRF